MSPRIVWVSRHQPTPRQRAALEANFPNHHLIIDDRSFDSASTITKRFRQHSGDEMVVVAPDAVIRAIIAEGIYPLRAIMTPVAAHADWDVRIKSRFFRSNGFERIRKLNFECDPLTPTITPATTEAQT